MIFLSNGKQLLGKTNVGPFLISTWVTTMVYYAGMIIISLLIRASHNYGKKEITKTGGYAVKKIQFEWHLHRGMPRTV